MLKKCFLSFLFIKGFWKNHVTLTNEVMAFENSALHRQNKQPFEVSKSILYSNNISQYLYCFCEIIGEP